MKLSRKNKIELVLSTLLIPILIGKYLDNKTLVLISGAPMLIYIGIYALDMLIAMGSNSTIILQGRITSIKETLGGNRIKLNWIEFDLVLEDESVKKFNIPKLEFPSNVFENDFIEVTYKQTKLISYTYVTKIRKLH